MIPKKRVVIALGGNAILSRGEHGTFEEQLRHVTETMEQVAELIAQDRYEIIITHGNGPQVGNLLLQQAAAHDLLPEMPMHMCGAMTQGEIGYLIQLGLTNALRRRHLPYTVVTVVTQVVVDQHSAGFQHPTKPVGTYLTEAEARLRAEQSGGTHTYHADSDRGWRRVVPSPAPRKIVELDAVKTLLSAGMIVVAAGGGGIPVIEDAESPHTLSGVEAVIDKDWTAALLARELNADLLLILTAVPQVYIRYHQPDQQALQRIDTQSLRRYLTEGHFAEGSMKPKIEAALMFIEDQPDWRQAIITDIDHLLPVLTGNSASSGTTITSRVTCPSAS